MEFDAVLFDMDGTLIDSERVWTEGLYAVASDFPGIDAFAASVVGVHVEGVVDLLNAWVPPGQDAARVLADWEAEAFARLALGTPLKPGALVLLERLRAQALPVAVVTSSGREHAQDLLAKTGISDALDALVSRDDVDQPKPHPEPYLKGAEALGVDIARCAAFEDSPVGVQSALASGARVVHVPDGKAPTPAFSDALVATSLMDGARKLGLI